VKGEDCIVDTNVPIVANGDNKDASYECRFRTIEFLENLMNSGKLIVDLEGLVEKEYSDNLKFGYPGVGNRFLQHFFSAHTSRISRVELGPQNSSGFKCFKFTGGLKNFDQSDRKFAALSIVTGRPVYVSIDSDWVISKEDLRKAGIQFVCLCGEDMRTWFQEKKRKN
jgi:hypothetical protein